MDNPDPMRYDCAWRIGQIYSPLMCEKVVEMGKQGFSPAEMSAELGCSVSSIQKWVESRPEFAEAMEHALLLARAWWEREARINIHNPQFNSSLWMMVMGNRFGWTRRIDGKFETVTKEVKRAEVSFQIGSPEDMRKVLQVLDSTGAMKHLLAEENPPSPDDA